MFTLNSCGKRKPPLPPVERVSQRVEIAGFQRGSRVILSWQMPARNTTAGSVLNISRADIYRLAEKNSSDQLLSEEEFYSRSTLIASLPITDQDFGLKRLTFSDLLEFANQDVTLRYAIRFVNSSGQKAAFSNFLRIEPSARIAESPSSLVSEITEGAVILKWSKPSQNVDGSQPTNIFGYNLYRSNSVNETAALVNQEPIKTESYADRDFLFGKDYLYFVRTVSAGANGELVESGESNVVRLLPKDVFPPRAPEALTIAASPNILTIFFAVNTEKDIAGYRIFRAEDSSIDKSQWLLLTPELNTTNTFQDKSVVSGKKYFYYLQAVDSSGNVSQPSEVVSEKAF